MSDDAMTVGAHGRPLWSKRDRQAEAVRDVLRAAGCREWVDRGDGENAAGFVVESEDPFQVGCAGAGLLSGLDQNGEERQYQVALTAAGYRVEVDPDGYGLQVWPVS